MGKTKLSETITIMVKSLGGAGKVAPLLGKSRQLIYLWCKGVHTPDNANIELLERLYNEQK